MLLFRAKTSCERVTQLWTSPSEEEDKKTFCPFGDFLVGYFHGLFPCQQKSCWS